MVQPPSPLSALRAPAWGPKPLNLSVALGWPHTLTRVRPRAAGAQPDVTSISVFTVPALLHLLGELLHLVTN